MPRRHGIVFLCACILGCDNVTTVAPEAEPLGPGPYAVASTNVEIAPDFADMGDDAMHAYLLGRPDDEGRRRYVADILKHPEAAFTVDVAVPNDESLYGPASGTTLPVVSFVTYPAAAGEENNPYAFPYFESQYGVFEHMLAAGEAPEFASADQRYPLILLAHGAQAHGFYDVAHAQSLASHGYIVAVLNYGDDRTAYPDSENWHVSFLRPLMTKAVLDALLESETFAPHIDADNIGITGHSFGGFTALALAGGPIQGNTASVDDERIAAATIAAPWVGGNHDGNEVHAFGNGNADLERVDIPVLCFFGTRDDLTLASYILPAMKELSGPTYVVELVDQPHIFEPGSWQDRDNWELLFFAAYLKNDADAQATLEAAGSMQGGNDDVQLFEYQKRSSRNAP